MKGVGASQRPGNIIVMIEEIQGKPVKAGESFSAAHIVGYFDGIEHMHKVNGRYKGHTGLTADASGWRLVKEMPISRESLQATRIVGSRQASRKAS